MMTNIIEIHNVVNQFDHQVVHEQVSLNIQCGEILALVGSSGCGKTTLLRNILMLHQPKSGNIRVFDHDLSRCSEREYTAIRKRWGVMFQQNALFSSLTVLENICYPLREFTRLDAIYQQEVALLRLEQVGLPTEVAWRYPNELSGGMQKRVALARAIIFEPELIFLDEPTTGLDPYHASKLEDLIIELQQTLQCTIVVITHDLDLLWTMPDRIAFLGEKRILAVEPIKQLVQNKHKLIQSYFSSPRSQWRINYFNQAT